MTAPSNLLDDKRLLWALTGIAVIAGILFRSWNIASEPMWLDESYSAYAASKSFAFLWNVVPRYETHPPFYYSLLRSWSLIFGDSLGALRAPGLICGMLTISMAGLAAREMGRLIDLPKTTARRLIVATIVLVSLAPMPVEMTREVRPYPVLILVMACQTALLFRLSWRMALQAPLLGAGFAAYLVLLLLTLWLHNLGILFAGAMGCAFLVLCFRRSWQRRDYLAFVIGHLLVLAAWIPAIAILADQAPMWISSTWLTFPPADLSNRIQTIFFAPSIYSIPSALLLVAAAIGIAVGKGTARRPVAALLILALLPLLASLVISALIAPIFILRTMTPLAVPGLMLFAFGAVCCSGIMLRLGLGALILLMVHMVGADVGLRGAPPPEQWHGIVRWIQARMKPGDVVLTYPNEGSLPFDRAVKDLDAHITSQPIPVAVPAINVGGWYPTGSRGVVSLPQRRLREIADGVAIRSAPTVWLVRMGPWTYDKGDAFVVAFRRERKQVDHLRSTVIDVVGLRRTELISDQPAATTSRPRGKS